ncbi:MAG: hypothetical protein WBZ19_10790, partial [Chthoniobacterales bacterium]
VMEYWSVGVLCQVGIASRGRVVVVAIGEGALLQHSNTPVLRATGFEDSLSDEAHALSCQPLEVGLASEARSTTRTLAK